MTRLAFALVLFAAAPLGATLPAAARDCAAVDAEARVAEAAPDLARLDSLWKEAASACPEDWREALGDDIAKTHVSVFFDKVGDAPGDSPVVAAHLALLTRAAVYGSPWQLLLTRAEIAYERRDYDSAAPLYAEAMNRMSAVADRSPAEAAALPDIDDFRRLRGRMSESALLASSYTVPPVHRGEPEAGLYTGQWRGYVVEAVPVPVQFAFGSSEFTDKGLKAAAHLARYLLGGSPKPITLVGHTDPVGPDAANLTLSRQRAAALKDFLVASGYKGDITIEGKGETEPFTPLDPARYAGDQEALYALDRRVELKR